MTAFLMLGGGLEPDLGRRKTTRFCLVRPLVAAGVIIVCYLGRTPVATTGGVLGYELALAASALSWARPPT